MSITNGQTPINYGQLKQLLRNDKIVPVDVVVPQPRQKETFTADGTGIYVLAANPYGLNFYVSGVFSIDYTIIDNVVTENSPSPLGTTIVALYDLTGGGSGYDIPINRALPRYAKSYAGTYYLKPSQTSSPAAFSSPYKTTAQGDFYEEPLPTDCRDGGLDGLLVFDGGNVVVPTLVVPEASLGTWDTTITDKVQYRQAGMRLQAFVPAAITTSTPLSYTDSYFREPIIPVSDTDRLDVPADDFNSFYDMMKDEVQTG